MNHQGAYSDWQMLQYAGANPGINRNIVRSGSGNSAVDHGPSIAVPRWYRIEIDSSSEANNNLQNFIADLIRPYRSTPILVNEYLFFDTVEAEMWEWEFSNLNSTADGESFQVTVLLYSIDWEKGGLDRLSKYLKLDNIQIEDETEKSAHLNKEVRITTKLLFQGAPIPIPQAGNLSERSKNESMFADIRDYKNPIGAIVDSGIGIHNECFLDKENNSRFKTLWIQGALKKKARSKDKSSPDNQTLFEEMERDNGNIIGGTLIKDNSQKLARGEINEQEIYIQYNSGLTSNTASHSTARVFSHGTAVADLAFGCSANHSASNMRDTDLIGVDLPRRSIQDTSGIHLTTNVLQAVRWILYQSFKMKKVENNGSIRFRPVVINVSLGAHAGNKFGEGFLAMEIDRYLKLYDKITAPTQSNDRTDGIDKTQFARVVYSFGNHHLENLCAVLDSNRKEQSYVFWQLLPDDKTTSFVELRSPDGTPPIVTIAGPDKSVVPESTYALKAGESADIVTSDNKIIGRVYGEVSSIDSCGTIVISLSPTNTYDARHPAPAGAWSISIPTQQPGSIGVQVQRDDTPKGYQSAGRQSYLWHPNLDKFQPKPHEENKADRSLPSHRYDFPKKPLTNEGDHSCWVGAIWNNQNTQEVTPNSISVGATILNTNTAVASSSSGVGKDNTAVSAVAGPDCSAPTALSKSHNWILAAGTYSGSTVRIGGTSAAAPLVSRRLIQNLLDTGTWGEIKTAGYGKITNESQKRLGNVTVQLAGRSARTPDSGFYS